MNLRACFSTFFVASTKGGDNMNNMVDITILIIPLVFIGFLTETIVEIIKDYFFKTKKGKKYLSVVSLLTALLLCFAMGVSLFEPDNIVPYYIGMVICGVVASRGSNYVHNFFDRAPVKR